mgnify:CR=1 FL=1
MNKQFDAIIKEVLRAMNIDIVEMEGYEADDVLGTLSRYGEKQGLDVKVERGERIFPVTDKSQDVLNCFTKRLKELKVNIKYNFRK